MQLKANLSLLDAAKAKTVAIAKVSKMTMYAVCFLHEVYSYVVPRKGVEFLPFAEKYDLKVQFDEGAFVGEDARVEFKVNYFALYVSFIYVLVQFLRFICPIIDVLNDKPSVLVEYIFKTCYPLS